MKTRNQIRADQIKKLVSENLTTTEIATKLGISASAVTQWKTRLGLEKSERKQFDWAEMQKAIIAGMTERQLTSTYDISGSSIWQAKQRGLLTPRVIIKKTKQEIQATKNEANARYRARKKGQTPLNEDIKALQEVYINCPPGYEVDHIIPLSKGGLHTLSNLQYLPMSDNRKKGNKIL